MGLEWYPLVSIDQLEGADYCGQVFHSFLLFHKANTLFILDQVGALFSLIVS